MISRFLLWLIGDLIAAKDGSISLTRTAAAFAHFSLFCAFVFYTVTEPFNINLWIAYPGATIFHATWDKTAAMVASFKDKALTVKETKNA